MAGRRLGAGKLRDAGLDIAGDFDLTSRSGAGLAGKGCERPDLTAAQSEAFELANGDSGVRVDVGIFQGGTMGTFVAKKQRDRTQDVGSLAALLITEGFEFMAFGF